MSAPIVVIATGAWSGSVGALAGVELPVTPARRSKFITAPFPFEKIPAATPFAIDPHLGISLRREGAGVLLGIGRREEAGSFSTALDWSLAGPLVDRALRRAADGRADRGRPRDHARHRAPRARAVRTRRDGAGAADVHLQ